MENKNKLKKIALCYDFDKTLSPSDCSLDFGFFEKLNINRDNFFYELNNSETLNKMDSILAFAYYTLYKAKSVGYNLTKEDFINLGKNAYFYNGVETWFKRINKYAKSLGYEIEHYIISAGIKEVLENTKIAKYFKRIYATSYIYNNETPIWPAYVVNYTNKTQYLYRIKKNVLNENDNNVNEKIEKNKVHIPFENMIYIGDSVTDIPCMSIMVHSGGNAIGVYEDLPLKKELMKKLFKNKRINYYCKADYSENSELEKTVKNIILNIKNKDDFKNENNELIK